MSVASGVEITGVMVVDVSGVENADVLVAAAAGVAVGGTRREHELGERKPHRLEF